MKDNSHGNTPDNTCVLSSSLIAIWQRTMLDNQGITLVRWRDNPPHKVELTIGEAANLARFINEHFGSDNMAKKGNT